MGELSGKEPVDRSGEQTVLPFPKGPFYNGLGGAPVQEKRGTVRRRGDPVVSK